MSVAPNHDLGSVLVVDGGPPDPTASAGLRSRLDLLNGLITLGFDVALHTTDPPAPSHQHLYDALAELGVFEFSSGGREALVDVVRAGSYATLIAHGPAWGMLSLAALNQDPELARVYWGHDIQQRRRAAQARVEGQDHAHGIKALQLIEERCWREFDATVYPTLREANIVSDKVGAAKGVASPYYWLAESDITDLSTEPGPRQPRNQRRLLMVGGAAHPPNKDCVEWTVSELAPMLVQDQPDLVITVVGDWPRGDIQRLRSAHVEFTGQISEGQLRELHSDSLCLLAPLRFGSGSRRKIVGAMGLGLPVVTTPEGQQGALVRDGRGLQDGLLIAENPAGLAAAVQSLREDPTLARKCAHSAQRAAAEAYSESAYTNGVARALMHASRQRDYRVAESVATSHQTVAT